MHFSLPRQWKLDSRVEYLSGEEVQYRLEIDIFQRGVELHQILSGLEVLLHDFPAVTV